MRQQDSQEPLLFRPGDFVWLENKRRRREVNPKLQPKFVGPYEVLQAFDNHTYKIGRQGQESNQSEMRLKKYTRATQPATRAPVKLEPRWGPNMKGARRSGRRDTQNELVPPPEVVPPHRKSNWMMAETQEDLVPRSALDLGRSSPGRWTPGPGGSGTLPPEEVKTNPRRTPKRNGRERTRRNHNWQSYFGQPKGSPARTG